MTQREIADAYKGTLLYVLANLKHRKIDRKSSAKDSLLIRTVESILTKEGLTNSVEFARHVRKHLTIQQEAP